ncbi:acyl-phosphate glycerol-3-phosphate acyltransferase [Desulfitobacterium dichloroeliminans LMG P-21439]|uniref:Glycerol-3-phosphate acyltransferase n=1 Tax=Desulfitobacterium dichloroeliminans (strain LMG P-21439 / DCA1) TaxID=871963 RepID=L0F9Q6_DESDL|nr:glycerol-3-phosphate 1-O-acyltransferase PlsY [Desulfitobacterium dichloroeliminans]AGA69760.1 acyl-phosphate glycerol-3-phosphate acyltransferase [Desulfitobacterium dichloroeliminans LMG P-21439]
MGEYAIFVIAYLLGAIPFAYFAGRFKGVDVRKHGSGNMGTTNAFRLLGAKIGALVLLGDALKGAMAAYLGYHFFGPWGGIVAGLLAMAGHSWNPFFGFKPSGKGVASGFGIILVLMPEITGIAIALFVLVVFITRYVSMGSVLGALTVGVLVFILNEPLAYKVFAVIAVSGVIIRHRTNLQRVLKGTENRINFKK